MCIFLQGTLERQQFDVDRAEEEAADVRNALLEVQGFLTQSLKNCNENILRRSVHS